MKQIPTYPLNKINYTTFIKHLKEDNLKQITVQGEKIKGSHKKPARMRTAKDSPGAKYKSGGNFIR
jgi:hypothetical protein